MVLGRADSIPRPPLAGSIALGCLTTAAVVVLLATATSEEPPWLPVVASCGDRLIVIGLTVGTVAAATALLRHRGQATVVVALCVASVVAVAAIIALAGTAAQQAWAGAEPATGAAQRATVPGALAGSGGGAGSATDTSPSADHTAAADPGDGKRRPAHGSSEPTAPPPGSASRSAPEANPYLPSQPTLIFSDPLTASSPAWAAEDETSSLCRIDDRGLHVIAGPEGPRPGCRTAVEVSDATVEIEFSFTGARQAGLVFHRSGTEAGYTVGVTRDGTISLAAVVGNLPGPDLIPPRARPAFDPAGWHRLAITIVGTTMTLYLDDEPVGVASGDLRGGGVIGVVIDRGQVPGDQPAPAECTFRNLRVWTA